MTQQERAEQAVVSQPRGQKIIAIASGKGGVGKSNVAVNLAVGAVRRGRRVLLVDADLGLANVDILLGLSCERTLADVLDGACSLAEAVVEGPAGLKVIPAGSGMAEHERLGADTHRTLREGLLALASDYDLVLIDTSAGIGANVLRFAAFADAVLVVTRPEPTAITDAYALIKVLVQHHDVGEIALLVNQTTGTSQGLEVHDRLSGVCSRFLSRALVYFGAVPADRSMERAVRERQPLLLLEPSGPAGSALSGLAARIDDLFGAPPSADHRPSPR